MARSLNSRVEPDIDLQLEYCTYTEELPYIRLWAAVFNKGVRDYCDTLKKYGEPYGKPAVWFFSDEYYPGSLTWLCDLFSLDPGQVRLLVGARWQTISAGSQGVKRKKTNNEII